MACNLKTRFGKQYRINFDDAADAHGRPRDKIDSYLQQIPCGFGTVFPFGGNYLAVDIDHHNVLANRVAKLPGCQMIQDGDFEKTIRFHVDQFEAVAEIVKPYRKRRVSEKEKARLRSIGSKKPQPGRVLASRTLSKAST